LETHPLGDVARSWADGGAFDQERLRIRARLIAIGVVRARVGAGAGAAAPRAMRGSAMEALIFQFLLIARQRVAVD
jgi:hypothetical protein